MLKWKPSTMSGGVPAVTAAVTLAMSWPPLDVMVTPEPLCATKFFMTASLAMPSGCVSAFWIQCSIATPLRSTLGVVGGAVVPVPQAAAARP